MENPQKAAEVAELHNCSSFWVHTDKGRPEIDELF